MIYTSVGSCETSFTGCGCTPALTIRGTFTRGVTPYTTASCTVQYRLIYLILSDHRSRSIGRHVEEACFGKHCLHGGEKYRHGICRFKCQRFSTMTRTIVSRGAKKPATYVTGRASVDSHHVVVEGRPQGCQGSYRCSILVGSRQPGREGCCRRLKELSRVRNLIQSSLRTGTDYIPAIYYSVAVSMGSARTRRLLEHTRQQLTSNLRSLLPGKA